MRTNSHSTFRWLAAMAIAVAALVAISQPRGADADVPGPITTRVMAIMQPGLANGGTAGMYVKEVGGAVIAGQNESTVIGPASAIKVLPHLYSVDQVEQGLAAFTDDVDTYPGGPGSCPDPLTVFDSGDEDLDVALGKMMRVSDNTATRAVIEHWTVATLNAYATSLGLTNTAFANNTLGCDALAIPPIDGNATTLADLGIIYEAVADGSELSGSFRQAFYNLMSGREQEESFGGDFTGIWPALVAMVADEAPVAMPQALRDSFIAGMTANHKGGSYARCAGVNCITRTEWLTWAGSAQLPTCEAGAKSSRSYVWGAYFQDVVDTAFNGTTSVAFQAFLDVRAEPLREQLHAALATWGDCFPHWEVTAKIGGGNVLNPGLPDYVPGTWARKNVVVYLRCVAGDAPIDIVRSDQAVTFRDGTSTFNTRPQDECIDENGVAAQPFSFGPIMVDTKAPNCKVTPTLIYVPRSAATPVVFGLDFADATSGYAGASASPVLSGGATIPALTGFLGGPPPTSFAFTAQMLASTAGRVEYHFDVFDIAGNVAHCTGTVRAK